MFKIILLGSSGSIGKQSLEVINLFPNQFQLVGLAVNTDIKSLEAQCKKFSVKNVHIFDRDKAKEFQKKFPNFKVFTEKNGLEQIVDKTDFDILINALSGEIGISPTLAAVKKGKIIALANKETLVASGVRIMKLAKKTGSEIRPIDSEHSAIWQSLRGENKSEVSKIILTCSGGPFRDAKKWPLSKLKNVTPKQALAHPNWNMGKKISIDSATLMNKALEIIEAVRLFNVKPEQVKVVIHPQSIIHSAVEFCDGSVIAQIGLPDMKTAISLALSAPSRNQLPFKKFSFLDQKLTFEKVDAKRFPSINYAYQALKKGEKSCAKLNLTNEKAVADFLEGKIGFLEIFEKVKKAL